MRESAGSKSNTVKLSSIDMIAYFLGQICIEIVINYQKKLLYNSNSNIFNEFNYVFYH